MADREKITGQEKAAGKGVPPNLIAPAVSPGITSSAKLLFEDCGITKGQLADYYKKVSERMMPYVRGRILSLVVCPKGTGEPCFYKKHPLRGDFCYVENLSDLLGEVQLNTIEFHIWGSRFEDNEKPDVMVFDLDPDEGLALDTVRRGVLDLKSILDKLGLRAYLKTSGNKGYHVVVPLVSSPNWETFRGFAKSVAQAMEQTWPQNYTTNIRKIDRKGKIFVDWLRNTRGATSIAPYSVRAKAGARVSMPISWKELDTVAPNGITMEEAVLRTKKSDPWKDFFETKKVQKLR